MKAAKNNTNVWEIGRLSGNSCERVGHPTQKPVELIRRFVKSLSYKGSIVLDFFAGSGTTGRVCIEEGRHSIMIDSNVEIENYLNEHLAQLDTDLFRLPYELIKFENVDSFLELVKIENDKIENENSDFLVKS